MKIIGLTGGIGSGKSTVGKRMEELKAVKLQMTDDIGHIALEQGTESYDKIIESFGKSFLKENGEIDRNLLGQLVFANQDKLEKLNAIIHPWVIDYLKRDIENTKKENKYLYYVVESAILFQTGLDRICEEIWYVDADEEIRRTRLQENRGYNVEKIDSIMAQQRENEVFKKQCQVFILNNGELSEVDTQIKKFLKE